MKDTSKATLINQLKAIRLTLIKEAATTCNHCDHTFVAMYAIGGHDLCPNCDQDTIETIKERIEMQA